MSATGRESRATPQNRLVAQRTLKEQLALDDGTRLAFLGVQWGKTKETTILKHSLYVSWAADSEYLGRFQIFSL